LLEQYVPVQHGGTGDGHPHNHTLYLLLFGELGDCFFFLLTAVMFFDNYFPYMRMHRDHRRGFTVWAANFYTGADSPEGVDEPRDDETDPEDDFCQEVALGEDG
jgi:hypothetical protein